jgi:glycosyltransferase involved in cell wall biosynthesis
MESILSQQDVDFEFIVVNDGSTDGSRDILADYSARDKRIRIIDQHNVGLTCALIKGCAEARCEFVARQDADDVSFLERLSKQVKLLKSSPDNILVSCWVEYIGPNDELLEVVKRPADPMDATEGLIYRKQGPPAHGSVIFRKEAYERAGGYREAFYYAQDSDLWLRMSQYGLITYVPEVLYRYRVSLNCITATRRGIQTQFAVLGHKCHAARLRGESEEMFFSTARQMRDEIMSGKLDPVDPGGPAFTNYFIGAWLEKQSSLEAKRYFIEALRINPLMWRAWLRLALNCIKHPGNILKS